MAWTIQVVLVGMHATAWLSGCVDINRPKAMIYSTSSYVLGDASDNSNNTYDMSISLLGEAYGYEDARIRYGEPSADYLTPDSSVAILELMVNTRPNLRIAEDFLVNANVKVEVSPLGYPLDSMGLDTTGFPAKDSVLIRYYRMGSEGSWVGEGSRREKWYPETGGTRSQYRRVLDFKIPSVLLDPSPVFGWALRRHQYKRTATLPSRPTLFIRNLKAFKELVYPISSE